VETAAILNAVGMRPDLHIPLLDRVEVGAVGRQEEQVRAALADGAAGDLALWLPSVGASTCSAQSAKSSPLIGRR